MPPPIASRRFVRSNFVPKPYALPTSMKAATRNEPRIWNGRGMRYSTLPSTSVFPPIRVPVSSFGEMWRNLKLRMVFGPPR